MSKPSAKKFLSSLHHPVADPAFITATVNKQYILAIKRGRGGQVVVITNKATILRVEALPPPQEAGKAIQGWE